MLSIFAVYAGKRKEGRKERETRIPFVILLLVYPPWHVGVYLEQHPKLADIFDGTKQFLLYPPYCPQWTKFSV